MTTTQPTADASADAFAERLFTNMIATFETMSIYVGDRLGWYAALRDSGPSTPDELAELTGTDPRYTREWLEQQAVYGILAVDVAANGAVDVAANGAPSARRYALPPGAAEVLTEPESLAFAGPLPRIAVAATKQIDALCSAYRDGGGVSWARFGDDARQAQAALNRPWFTHRLATALAGIPPLQAQLARPGAAIADVGCGFGWSSLALARAYPNAQVTGFDIDEPSIAAARANAAAVEPAVRPTFHLAEGSVLADHSPFDVVFAFECLHDMPRPVDVLAAARTTLAAGGCMIVVDEAVADQFTAPGDEVEKFMYGCSVFVCLPDGLSSPPSVGTGTVMRASTLTAYAHEAGFRRVDVLPIEGFSLFRFYRLTP